MNKTFKQYLETALWASNDDDGTPLDTNYCISDVESESLEQQETQLNEFIEKASKLLGKEFDDLDETDVAHDFFLTRNGHGCGFWDGDYPDELGEALTALCDEFGTVDAYVGDDGLIHFS